MLTQKVSTIDELLQFVSTLRQKHGVRLWFRGEENADLTLIPSSDFYHPDVDLCAHHVLYLRWCRHQTSASQDAEAAERLL